MNATRVCKASECCSPAHAKELCVKHYARLVRNGTAELAPRPNAEERFWAKVNKTPTCWLWTGSVNPGGYGQVAGRDGKRKTNRAAHRVAYDLLVGAVPEGMHLDHMCYNRNCVNPAHLRVATSKQNAENRQGAPKNSVTGIRGVHLASNGKYTAAVKQGRKKYHLGTFTDIKEATAAAIAKRNELFTHNDIDRQRVSA